MITPHPFAKAEDSIVYVRPVAAHDLPAEVREKIGDEEDLFAVHSADGERLALVRDRSMAFVLARQNHMHPVNVH
jgi:hypothetical protein